MHAQARFAAAAAAAHKAIAVAPKRKASLSTSSAAASTDDEEAVEHRTSAKRKRSAAELDAHSAASSASSPSFPSSSPSFSSSPSSLSVPCSSFPFLSDDEPSLASSSFRPVSKFLFALTDETRDRGSAKLCIVHVQLSHPAFASTARHFTTSFKIDGRKSFSNAPFKRYYSRGVHAAWFAQPTDATAPTLPAPNATFQTSSEGRVLFVLSQRNGRPHGKGFTGLKHDRMAFSSKHPLLCLSSNSVEYYLSVFVNLAARSVDDEQSPMPASCCWSEVDVDVAARFDAGEVTLEPVTMPSAASASVSVSASASASAPAATVAAAARRQPRTHIPHVSSLSSLRATAGSPFASGSASPSVSTASSATASPVSPSHSQSPSPALSMSRCSSTDSAVSSASASSASSDSSDSSGSSACSSDHCATLASPVLDPSCAFDDGAVTPLHEQLLDELAAGEFDFADEPQFAGDDDVLGAESVSEDGEPQQSEQQQQQQQQQQQYQPPAHQGAWCLLPESSESAESGGQCAESESADPLRHSGADRDCMAFAFEQWAPDCAAPLASPTLAPALSQYYQQQQCEQQHQYQQPQQYQPQSLLLDDEAAEPSPWKRARLEIALQSVADSLLPAHLNWAACSPVVTGVHPHALSLSAAVPVPVCSPLPSADLQMAF